MQRELLSAAGLQRGSWVVHVILTNSHLSQKEMLSYKWLKLSFGI